MCFGAVQIRVDVAAAGENQPVEDAERLCERVAARRHDQRTAARVLDRPHIAKRNQRGLLVPDAPLNLLGVGSYADQRLHQPPSARSTLIPATARTLCEAA